MMASSEAEQGSGLSSVSLLVSVGKMLSDVVGLDKVPAMRLPIITKNKLQVLG